MTPFHRDVIEKLAGICQKVNLEFELFYSQHLDWHKPNGGGHLIKQYHILNVRLGGLGRMPLPVQQTIKAAAVLALDF